MQKRRGRPSKNPVRPRAIAVRPHPDVYAQIEQLAKSQKRTMSQMALLILERGLEEWLKADVGT